MDREEIRWPTEDEMRDALDDETLPDDTLIELGRLTWATIKLEACCDEILSLIEWSVSPKSALRPTSQRIQDAIEVLEGWPVERAQDAAIAWLFGVREALDRRQTILHGSIINSVPFPGTVPIPLPPALSHVSRRDEEHVITGIEPGELGDVTDFIREKRAGWKYVYTSIEDALVEMQSNAALLPDAED